MIRLQESQDANLFKAYESLQRFPEMPKSFDGKIELIRVFYGHIDNNPLENLSESRVHAIAERLYKKSRDLVNKLSHAEKTVLETLYLARVNLNNYYRARRTNRNPECHLDNVENLIERASIQLENIENPKLLRECDRLIDLYRRLKPSEYAYETTPF